ncbi:MAG: hypothetical protein AABZ57_07760 [Candidatus Margulisiibacteriota bacterium]
MKKERFLTSLVLVLILVLSPVSDRQASASWQGVSSWQEVQLGYGDTFLHMIVGNAIGSLIQTKFQDEDRRSQFIKALMFSLSIGLLKELYDVHQQYRYNKALNLPDSIKDMGMNFLGVFLSFNFDFGAPKKNKPLPRVYEEFPVSLGSTPESVFLRADSLYQNLDFTISK